MHRKFTDYLRPIGAFSHPVPVRAKRARELVEVAEGVLSRTRQEAIYDSTREKTWDGVANKLGTSTAAINKAITAHRRSMDAEH
ncbi:hypothetical protein [Saccharopolyspora shandongensis]|uniref:hypothetical protein n=1 Tax=Saccharopolyspora shandongensis TaxID=418495 RepID=UPI0034001F77